MVKRDILEWSDIVKQPHSVTLCNVFYKCHGQQMHGGVIQGFEDSSRARLLQKSAVWKPQVSEVICVRTNKHHTLTPVFS